MVEDFETETTVKQCVHVHNIQILLKMQTIYLRHSAIPRSVHDSLHPTIEPKLFRIHQDNLALYNLAR